MAYVCLMQMLYNISSPGSRVNGYCQNSNVNYLAGWMVTNNQVRPAGYFYVVVS